MKRIVLAALVICAMVSGRALAQEDTTPPILTDVFLTPPNIDTTVGEEWVRVVFSATDDLSGVSTNQSTPFVSPSGQGPRNYGSAGLVSGTRQDGTFEIYMPIPQYSETGTWRLTGFGLQDLIGNSRYYTRDDLIALGFTMLDVVNAPVSTTSSSTSSTSSTTTTSISTTTTLPDQCPADLAQCQSSLSSCQSIAAMYANAYNQCNTDLAQAEDDLAQCTNNLGECSTDLSTCSADLSQASEDLGQCEGDLAECLANPQIPDADGDGIPDSLDSCPDTPAGVEVDQAGCSLEQFCSAIDVTERAGKRTCKKADWQNDEPLMRSRDRDCTFDKGERGPEDDRCVPNLG